MAASKAILSHPGKFCGLRNSRHCWIRPLWRTSIQLGFRNAASKRMSLFALCSFAHATLFQIHIVGNSCFGNLITSILIVQPDPPDCKRQGRQRDSYCPINPYLRVDHSAIMAIPFEQGHGEERCDECAGQERRGHCCNRLHGRAILSALQGNCFRSSGNFETHSLIASALSGYLS